MSAIFLIGAIQQNYSVPLDPGVVSHRMKPMAVSVKRALRIVSSRSLPGGMVLARFLTFWAWRNSRFRGAGRSRSW